MLSNLFLTASGLAAILCVSEDPVVLRQDAVEVRLSELLDTLKADNPQLAPALESPTYRPAFLASPYLHGVVRAYADRLLLDAADLATVGEAAILAEAGQMLLDRGGRPGPGGPEAWRSKFGIEAEVRARLLAEQPDQLEEAALRQHFNRSPFEYFGVLTIRWIHPLFVDKTNGRLLAPAERAERIRLLERLRHDLDAGTIDWEEAVRIENPEGPRADRLGAVRRKDTRLLEEPMLRAAFSNLGNLTIREPIYRGPIVTDQAAYLLRIESARTEGVVDMELVRDRVVRSLREQMLQARMAELRDGVQREILLPIIETPLRAEGGSG